MTRSKEPQISSKLEIIAKTFSGLEQVLAAELKALGAEQILLQNRAVSYLGDHDLLYKSNLWLRTALRVLKSIHQFSATNEHRLYRGIQEIEWRDFLSVEDSLAVSAVVSSPHFNHSQYVALKVKDAIVDQFRQHFGRRPSVDVENPTLRIHIHIADQQCSLALDSSGESLHKRGYRLDKNVAPLNEALAAGLLLLAGWSGEQNFVDPMCGSGTIAIEAAMLAYNIPPGHNRKFGFMKWRDWDSELWQRIRSEATAARRQFDCKIVGTDISRDTVRAAHKNVMQAGLDGKIDLAVSAFESFIPPVCPGLLVMNPPYGERMKKSDIEAFYKMIGDSLKQRFAGYEAWILSGNKGALKHIGLRPSQKHVLFNGGLECTFQRFSIYQGSVKSKYTHQNQTS